MKIVINGCHGGFGLSEAAEIRFKEHYSITDPDWYSVTDICRADPYLIQLIEEMGNEAQGAYAKLKIVEIPDGVDWQIEEYDGMEWIAEKHRTWS